MQSILNKYQKAKQVEIDRLKKELTYWQEIENDIKKRIDTLNEKLNHLNVNNNFSSVLELQVRNSFYSSLKKEVEIKNADLEKVQKKIDKIKNELSHLLGEKKAIEKYIQKIKKEKEREVEKSLQRLYDDTFARRNNRF